MGLIAAQGDQAHRAAMAQLEGGPSAFIRQAADELYAIGFDDYLARAGVIIMEWCENVPEALPRERLELHLVGSGMEPRAATLAAYGARYEAILETLEGFPA